MLEYGLEWHALDTYFQFKEIDEPATPQANHIRQYATDSGGISTMCWKNDAGNVTCLPTGGGTIPTGSGGVSGAVAFWTSATTLGADDTHFHWDDTNDQLLIGINSGSHLGTDSGLLLDENASSSIIGTAAHSATAAHAGALNLLRSRGTHAAQTIVASGDKIGRIVGQGYDGAAYRDAAAIDVEVDGTPASGDMPGRLVFLTTLDGSTTLVQRGSIDNAGKMYLANSAKTHTGTNFKLSLDSDTEVTGLEINAHHTASGALFFNTSRGTHALPTIVVSGDRSAFILGKGYDGVGYIDLASIQFAVDGTPGVNDMPGRIGLFTTADGASSSTERFRIGNVGQWGIGGATYGSSGDIFSSGGASAAPTWVTRATLNAALDHGTLAGLADDDHTQYALLAGRSGGQILKGGTASGDDLTLQSTNNATRGNIFLGSAQTTGFDEANQRFGVLTASPSALLTVASAQTSVNVVEADQYSNNGTGVNFSGRKSRGATVGAHTALTTNDVIIAFRSAGSDGSAFGSGFAFLRTLATEAFTSTAQGTKVQIQTVPNTSLTAAVRAIFEESGHFILPELATDPTTTHLAADAAVSIYNKNDKFVIAYNNGGTITYISIPLDGATTTWTHNTTAP